jgi:hypothetical protein
MHMMGRALFSFLALLVVTLGNSSAQKTLVPTAQLRAAAPLILPGNVDSNSPALWDRLDGKRDLFVLTSFAGQPSRATGGSLTALDQPVPVSIEPWPGGGVWIEAIVKDRDAWYGFYHNENQASMCGNRNLNYARIGAVRSEDFGVSWTNLGVILDLPSDTFACATRNTYFVGGAGDLSVLLDRNHRDLYIYFSQYGRDRTQQGIGVARLAWADRDEPVGKLMVWSSGVWLPPTLIDEESNPQWVYPKATPLVTPARPWHDNDRVVDAFWGPSIHWNSYLKHYVMLLNRASDETFAQEGIYVSFSPRLGDPLAWSTPERILRGGRWYPQVVGLEDGRGSDAWAGQTARFFLSGRSDHLIEFNLQ